MESSAGCLAPELQRPVVIVGASDSQSVRRPRRGTRDPIRDDMLEMVKVHLPRYAREA
jgi:hypothetical protein